MTSRPKPYSSSYDNHSSGMARHSSSRDGYPVEPKTGATVPPHSAAGHERRHHLPIYNSSGHKVTKGIQPDGESGRRGIHPLKFLAINFRSTSRLSMAVNVLWPTVPAAIALRYARPDLKLAIFIVSYIAMVPAANTIGFAGQELARKLPKVLGIVIETGLGSIVEIILFMVLIARKEEAVIVIRAAILGSILANLLLCLGLCFFAGGVRRHEQSFHEAVSEVGSGLMLVAGMGLVIPSIFSHAVATTRKPLTEEVLSISRGSALILLMAFFIYLFFQMKSHHGIYDEILESDEHKDADGLKDRFKAKLTLSEACLALAISVACVSLIAVFLVEKIEYIVDERGVQDAFVGLILVPLVEKAAEHLTAIDEAWDNQMNFALAHVLGASIFTALFNTPLVVIVGWGMGVPMNLDFEIFESAVLILAILVVGNFLRDGKSNYLEGALCVLVYVTIALCAFYYPNPHHGSEGGEHGGGENQGGGVHERGFKF